MYPKNAASPERIAVGAVVLIADGTVQTSGVSITVVPQGGASGAGGGTTTYEQGVVFYVPTQAETNYTSFIVTAYKASCIPVSTTVVTTASATAGQVRLEGVTHTSAVIPTVTTLTGNTAQTGDSFARLGAPAAASIAADLLAIDNFVDGIEATLAAGVVLADASSDAVIADAVWNAATATYGAAGSYGLLTETNLDAAVTTRMATYTQPTGFLAATFPGTVASTTNITAATGVTVSTNSDKTGYALTATTGLGNQTANITGTITTTTNLTNLPAAAALEATLTAMKGATFAGATDSLEAIRDRGDAAWITATGFATPTNITAGTITTVTNLTNAPTAGDLTATMKTSVTTAATAATPTAAAVTGAVGSVTGNVGGSVASVTAGVTLAASAVQAIWDAATAALTTVGSIGKKLADWTIGTAQTGDSFARLGAPAGASVSADVAAIKAKTDLIPAAPAAVGDIPSAAAITTAVLTTQMTEAYRADGAAPTLAQGICETIAHLGESSISTTTKTIKKVDGTTTAATFTLNSATAPTSITRAT